MVKAELLECAKNVNNSEKNYLIDAVASSAGHKVVRLPPYHCQYNPLTFIWPRVKLFIRKKNVQNMAELTAVLNEALNSITSRNWTDALKHADQERESGSKIDIAVENYFESFINNVLETSDSYDDQSE